VVEEAKNPGGQGKQSKREYRGVCTGGKRRKDRQTLNQETDITTGASAAIN